MEGERAGFWVIQKWPFSKFTRKPSEPVHPGICLQQQPNHLPGSPLTSASKTLRPRCCVTKEGREKEAWALAGFPATPLSLQLWRSEFRYSFAPAQQGERSLPVLSRLRRITSHWSAAMEYQMQALPHHHVALLAGDNWRWGVGACPLPERWISSLSLALSFKRTDPVNGCHLQGQPAFVEAS